MKEYKDKYSMSVEENILVAKRNLVDYLWKSANLEGIAVTYPQTEVIADGFSVNGLRINDINAIVNLKHAWQFTLENIDYPMDFRYLSQLNKLIGEFNVTPFPGELRTSIVDMGGTTWKPEVPNQEKIEKELQEMMKIQNITERALTVMLYLMRTQAFHDGNKRTSMLAANQIMIQYGKGIISIPIEHQLEFREKLIDFYETNKMETLREFLYDHCITGLHLQKGKKIENPWEEKLKKDKEGLER